jgi:hypothetical protein
MAGMEYRAYSRAITPVDNGKLKHMNTSTNTLPAVSNPSHVPSSYRPAANESLINSRGTVVGQRSFFGTKSASDIKTALKAAGLKGTELTEKVNECLVSEGAQRLILATAWVQSAAQNGFLPDVGDLRKNTGTLRMVKPKVTAMKITQEAALAALGLTVEEFQTMRLALAK